MARDAVLSEAEREEQIRELRAEARRATAQSEIEENARRWLETAGDDAAARASAFAAGGYLDPGDFTAARPGAPRAPPAPPSSSDSAYSVGSSESDSDASDSRSEPLFGALTEPRVEAEL